MGIVQEKDYRRIFNQSRKNWRWFEENRERLLEEYPEEFVVISEKRVVAHGPQLDQALEELPPDTGAKNIWLNL